MDDTAPSITDRTTNARLEPSQIAVTEVPGTDLRLVVIVVPEAPTGVRVDLTYPTADGTERWRF